MRRIAKINLEPTRGYGFPGTYLVAREFGESYSTDRFETSTCRLVEQYLSQDYEVTVTEVETEETSCISWEKDFPKIMRRHQDYAYLEKTYALMLDLYEVEYHGWDQIHLNYTPAMFCEKNRRSLISEYLAWEEWVEKAKSVGIGYYYGIDMFLEEYKDAVHSRVTLG